MADADQNLIDLARAEDFTDEDFERTFAETGRDRLIIDRLKGPGAHLLEGPRGVGKSTLLKKAELELDSAFQTTRTLGVYVNFKASLLVETGTPALGYDPFMCWVAAKVLDAFYKKARKVQLLTTDEITDRYRRHFGIGGAWSARNLESNIRDLQSLSMASSDAARGELLQRLGDVGLEQFANVEAVADFVQGITERTRLTRVIFLFDEAAHTFDERQQEAFFQFFKLLHGSSIAVKAATYPGITTYGGNFEIGHDAIKLSISSFDENLADERAAVREHFRALLRLRIPPKDFKRITARGEALDLLVFLSHGNPRMFLQTVSKWLPSDEFTKRSALAASNNFVSHELTTYHLGLKQRLPRFASHIDLGMTLIKAHMVPELQKKNQGKGPNPRVQTAYFTVEATIPYKVQRAISLLQYSGFLFAKGVVKTAGRRQAPRYALHLGVAANDKIFHSSLSRDPDEAIKRLSIADYREFYASDDRWDQLITEHPSAETCPNNHPRQADGDFCPICGDRFTVDGVIQALLADPVEKLALTTFLKGKLQNEFDSKTVRDTLSLTETQLQRAKWIGPVRARLITNAAEEYITG